MGKMMGRERFERGGGGGGENDDDDDDEGKKQYLFQRVRFVESLH